ncbi:MAG: porin family protein [Myxococcales bacterium]|nr:porin family protein [Myxococcales bacterium]MDH5565523.1 porin family protein [Myxococcales bacterium]
MARALALATLLVLTSAPAAAADEAEDYAREGFYVGASIAGAGYTGVAKEVRQRFGAIQRQEVCKPPPSGAPPGTPPTCTWLGYSTNTFSETSAGLNARVGYRLRPRLATEVQFEWLTKSQVNSSGDFEQNDVFELSSWVVTVNAKGYVIPTGRVQPFLSAGVGMISVDTKENAIVWNEYTQQFVGLDMRNDDMGFVLRMGGGVDFAVTRNLVVEFDISYVQPTGGVSPFSYVSGGMGLQYRF